MHQETQCYEIFEVEVRRKSPETIFTSFFLPCMDYGDVLYTGTYDSDLCKLDKILIDNQRTRSNPIKQFQEWWCVPVAYLS